MYKLWCVSTSVGQDVVDDLVRGQAHFHADAGNWPNVESVEAFMLVRSAVKDVQYTDVKTYQLGGAVSVGPRNDNFRRLISHTSVSLRNLKLMIRGEA